MTDQERDDLLRELKDQGQRLERRFEGLEQQAAEGFSDLRERIDTVDNRVSDLRRDLEEHGMVPPAEATG